MNIRTLLRACKILDSVKRRMSMIYERPPLLAISRQWQAATHAMHAMFSFPPFFLDEIVRALRGCSCGSRGFLEFYVHRMLIGCMVLAMM